MLRLRDSKGRLINVGIDPYFVEICDNNGDVGTVFYQPEPNIVSQIEPATEEANIYSDKYNVKFVKVIDLAGHHENLFKEFSDSK